jgi:hypothetical protein
MAGSIYFVTALTNAEAVRNRLHMLVSEDDLHELAPDQWVVVYDGGAPELADAAGIRTGDECLGTGLALKFTTCSGRLPASLWDWLKTKTR